ncbi:hypothetical protein PVK06_030890 [Gossypium arboreum]|uniref:Uncharacterized protein n=1 Tax=Gossypium arboreum TaxID=29729 RepID=A0ABR0NPI3_GOSAR|nr:hypothetical protein PVK06_030890 [Gossypium arboreum]
MLLSLSWGFPLVSSMEEDLNSLLEKLKFSKEETTKIVSTNLDYNNTQGFEAWAIGKLWSIEKVNREAMYQVFKSIWYTKEEANFVAMKGVSFIMFENVEDRKRILNLSSGCLTSASLLCFLMLKKQRWIHMLSTYLHFGYEFLIYRLNVWMWEVLSRKLLP